MMVIEKSKGFTLIEVMLALTVMAIAFIALCGLHLTSFKTDIRNRDETRALLMANQKLEELRSQTYSSVFGGEDTTSSAPFNIIWTANTIEPWQKVIFVTVSWPERIKSMDGSVQDRERSVRVATILVDLN